MSKKFIFFLLVACVPHFGYAKIYDCFPFFNELEILDIRLHELYDHVDKFILVESVETFSGNPKPLYYEENRERYKKFSDKIIHIVLEEKIETSDPWVREKNQRNQIMKGLKDCLPDDIILISDVDELVRGSVIPKIVHALLEEKKPIVMCQQSMYRYYLNVKDVAIPWEGTCATTFKQLSKSCPDTIRINRNGIMHRQYVLLYPLISNAGWHFTFMGGLEAYVKKIESYSHQENNCAENKTKEAMWAFMKKTCKLVPLDDTFPAYVLDNQDYFFEQGYIYEGPFTNRKPQRRSNIFRARKGFG